MIQNVITMINKYINFDLDNGLRRIKVALMNLLNEFENNELKEYELEYIDINLLQRCLIERNWIQLPNITNWRFNKIFIEINYNSLDSKIKIRCI